MISLVLGCVLQGAFVLALAPGVNGFIKWLKARMQTRQGPPLHQPYLDLLKWLGKSSVYSEHASWVSRTAPSISFSAIIVTGLLVTTVLAQAPLSLSGDLIAVVYLFTLARCITALAGLDAAGAFGGMGSSRELAISALAEPVLLLALFVPAINTGTTSLPHIVAAAPGSNSASYLLAFAALYIVLLAETGRVPVDNPDTHLELTMVHEAMILEATGRGLALYHWGAMVKQLVLLSILADVFVPWGLALSIDSVGKMAVSALLYLGKISVLAAALAVTETGMAKLRIFRVPDLMGTAFALALLGLAAEAAFHA
ncbi:MAG: hypothetical protein JWO59_3431 [Chloroflexi bacterium]|nr:hypothetical protein [Chloroflexota bacterium]